MIPKRKEKDSHLKKLTSTALGKLEGKELPHLIPKNAICNVNPQRDFYVSSSRNLTIK